MEKHIDFNEKNQVASWDRLKNYVLNTDKDKKEAVTNLYESIRKYSDKPEPVVVKPTIVRPRNIDLKLMSKS